MPACICTFTILVRANLAELALAPIQAKYKNAPPSLARNGRKRLKFLQKARSTVERLQKSRQRSYLFCQKKIKTTHRAIALPSLHRVRRQGQIIYHGSNCARVPLFSLRKFQAIKTLPVPLATGADPSNHRTPVVRPSRSSARDPNEPAEADGSLCNRAVFPRGEEMRKNSFVAGKRFSRLAIIKNKAK